MVAAATGVRPSAQDAVPLPRAATSADFYYFGNERIPLVRSSTEAVVEFVAGSASEQRRAIETLLPLADVGRELETDGRTLQLVTLEADGVAALGAPQAQNDSLSDRLRSLNNVRFAAPVYVHPATGKRIVPTNEIIVRLRAGGRREELSQYAASLGLELIGPMWRTQDQFILRLLDPAGDSLATARTLHESGRVQWAEPDLIQEYEKSEIPNDPLFGQQWHLQNTGQGGGTSGADAHLVDAWNIERGSPNITIAIIDDGVQIDHQDLYDNRYINPGEIPFNGLDDDANGFVDDVSGWDFSNNDNDPNPVVTTVENHGTAVAGVAAAVGNNATGVSGACRNCRILPVKIVNGSTFASSSVIGNAIRYAATLADVLNNSWGGGAPSNAILSALVFAMENGRGGKGSVVLFASGNNASGYGTVTPSLTIPAGTHRYRWEYVKDSIGSAGNDTAWLAWVLFPGSQLVTFEAGTPPGWVTGGHAPWTIVTDPVHGDEGACLTRAAKAGSITHSQVSYLEGVRTTPVPGSMTYYRWISSQSGSDGLRLLIDLNNNGTYDFIGGLGSGAPAMATGVSYPAALPEVMAVGASTNFDCRSGYSQYGADLDLVAPSSGGPLNLGIQTTDLLGVFGYASGHYFSGFGGTSSATPLAAGIAGLILSHNPNLSVAQVRKIMQDTADKVGPEPYVDGRNDRYGSGRLNAYAALHSLEAVPPQIQSQPASPSINSGQNVQVWVTATGTGPLAYQWYAGPTGTTSDPIAGATGSVLTTPALYATTQYWVRVSNAAGYADSNTATVTVLPVSTLLSPAGQINTRAPSFTWAAVAGMTEYLLWVNDATQQARINMTYTAAAAGCAAGIGTCTVSPGVTLAGGDAMWWIRASNSSGPAPWSSGLAFAPVDNTPPTVTILTPSATGSYTTSLRTISVSGTASDDVGVTKVTWSTEAEDSGVATGTTNWTIDAVPLRAGLKYVTVVAHDAFNNTATTALRVFYKSPPGPATLLAPQGPINTVTPTFQWRRLPEATKYELWVNDASQQARIRTVYSAEDAGCAQGAPGVGPGVDPDAPGSDTCNVSPGIALAPGNAVWWIQTLDDFDQGTWNYTGMAFTVPAAADSVAPSIAIATPSNTGTYTTTNGTLTMSGTASDNVAVTQVTWSTDRGGSGVASGTTAWTIGALPLVPGATVITVVARDAANNTANATLTATYTPPLQPATLLSPGGAINTTTPSFTWQAVGGATDYLLWVNDSSQQARINTTYSAAAAGCAGGTGSCSISPGVTLSAGAAAWWIQTSNSTGPGPWSSGRTFTVPAPADTTAPSISIGAPSATGTHTASSSTIAMSGSARDNVAVTQVSWSTDRGGSGVATGTTAWTIDAVSLAVGVTTVTVVARDAANNTASATLTVTYNANAPPGPATLVSPSGTITTRKPAFLWQPVSGATSYQLWVNDASQQARINTTYTASAASCPTGTGICGGIPDVELATGTATWWIRTSDSSGAGSWSTGRVFTVPPPVDPTIPGPATLSSPTGTISTQTPTFRWHTVSNATHYQLWVNDSTQQARIDITYSAAALGCDGATSCSVTPTVTLAAGAATWWIRTANAAGAGTWSAGSAFTVPPPVSAIVPPGPATLVEPRGAIAQTAPSFRWLAVPGATEYLLWVNDSSQQARINTTYTAAGAGCASGTGTCTVSPGVDLAAGPALWWIRSANGAGVGAWSNGLAFTSPDTSTTILLRDDFTASALDSQKWFIPSGAGTFLGRTQLRPPVEPVTATGGVLRFSAAFDAGLVPASTAQGNQTFWYEVDFVEVSTW